MMLRFQAMVGRFSDAMGNRVLGNQSSGKGISLLIDDFSRTTMLTMISSLVIDQLSDAIKHDSGKTCITWIYCDYRDEAHQTSGNFVGALLRQIILANHDVCDTIIQDLQKMKPDGALKLDSGCRVLTEALRKFKKAYRCIDALDECQEHRPALLRLLNELLENPELKKIIRIFITGRPQAEQYVEEYLKGATALCSMNLEARKTIF
jgi:hypothetical protein